MEESDWQENERWEEVYSRGYLLIRKSGWRWQSIGAALGLACGMLAIVCGALLMAITRVVDLHQSRGILNEVELALFLLFIPLLLLGTHCLDLLEKKALSSPRRRQEDVALRLSFPRHLDR